MTEDIATLRDRAEHASRQPLSSRSLVGSFFHGDGNESQGIVVAEVAPETYLVEFMEWVMGTSHHQELRTLKEMESWSFYDNAEWMRNNYTKGNP